MNELVEQNQLLNQAAHYLSTVQLMLALGLVSSRSIKLMIRLYQVQSVLLISIVLITSAQQRVLAVSLPMLLATLPPLVLAITVEYMLARATLPPPEGRPTQYFRLAYWRSLPPQAASIWLRQRPPRISLVVGSIQLMLVMVTYVIAFPSLGKSDPDLFSLAISLGLLVLGLFALGTQRNLIAQVMGLLVAEHGLFLAVIRIAPPETLAVFVLSLFLYILLTLMILLVLLPDLRRASDSMSVNDQRELRG